MFELLYVMAITFINCIFYILAWTNVDSNMVYLVSS